MTAAAAAVVDELDELAELERVARREAILRGRLDVLARTIGYDPAPLHLVMQRHVSSHDQTMIQAFRGAGKTSNVTVVSVLSHILRNPNVRIAVVSRTDRFAQSIVTEIRKHLESPAIVALFGDQRSDHWSNSAFTVSTRTLPDKTPTLIGLGVDGQTVGLHVDLLYLDDIVDEANSRTAHMRDQTYTFLTKSLLPILDPVMRGTERGAPEPRPYGGDPHPRPGELHVLGTRYDYDDLYGRLLRLNFFDSDQVLRIPIADEHGRSAWPDRFPPARLRRIRRQQGATAWATQFQCDAQALAGDVFRPDWIRSDGLPADDVMRIALGVDPATSDKPGSCDFAIASVGVDSSGTLWVLRGHTAKIPSMRQQEALVGRWNRLYSPIGVGIESNAFQVMLGREVVEMDPTVPVIPIQTRLSKRDRALQLQPLVESGRLRFAPGTEHVAEQFARFPAKPDDLVDAVGLAIAVMRRWAPRHHGAGSVAGIY